MKSIMESNLLFLDSDEGRYELEVSLLFYNVMTLCIRPCTRTSTLCIALLALVIELWNNLLLSLLTLLIILALGRVFRACSRVNRFITVGLP